MNKNIFKRWSNFSIIINFNGVLFESFFYYRVISLDVINYYINPVAKHLHLKTNFISYKHICFPDFSADNFYYFFLKSLFDLIRGIKTNDFSLMHKSYTVASLSFIKVRSC